MKEKQVHGVSSNLMPRRLFLGSLGGAVAAATLPILFGRSAFEKVAALRGSDIYRIEPVKGVVYNRAFLKYTQRRKFNSFQEAVEIAAKCGKPVHVRKMTS